MSPEGTESRGPAVTAPAVDTAGRSMLVRLVLAQFVCSFAATTICPRCW